MQRDTRGYGKARIEILSLKGRVVPWREYGNNTDVFPPRKNTSSRPIRAKLNRVTNKQREEREKERYENISFSRSRARFRSLRSKWVMRTRRTNDPDGRMREPAVHSRRKEFGGGKERRITGLARRRWEGGWRVAGTSAALDHRGKLATSAKSRPRRRESVAVGAPQPLLSPSFLPSFSSFLSLRLASYLRETTPLPSPFLLGIRLGRRGRGLEGVGRVCAAATVDRIVCAHAQPKVRQLRH